MVTFTDKIIYLPTNGSESAENQYRNDKASTRIGGLRKKYEVIVPQELQTRFILDGRVRKDSSLEELVITPMENVSDELWAKLQFILP